MTLSDNDARLISDSRISSTERGREPLETRTAEKRSIIERRFSQMEQAHDRIRAEELAARRRERPKS